MKYKNRRTKRKMCIYLTLFFSYSTILLFLTLPTKDFLFNSRSVYSKESDIYLDPSFSIEERVENLLSLMTLEEKIGQLNQRSPRTVQHVSLEDEILNKKTGSFLQLFDNSVAKLIDVNKKSRLKIPILFGIDAIHGNSFHRNATIFPTQLGMSFSWDYEAIKRVGSITAYEMRYTGVPWTFAPVACIGRDLRWGRLGETFGEDPYLVGLFCEAMIKGLQGEQLSNDPDKVLACIKHYVGYSQTVGGLDSTEQEFSRRTLESWFFPPFERAIKAGVGSVMSAFQSISGVPCVINKWLLKDKLRGEYGFDGFVVSDWNTFGAIQYSQRVVKTSQEAAELVIKNGNDMIMTARDFVESAIEITKQGKISMDYIDENVRNILRIKFKLGLFEDPRYPDVNKIIERNCNEESTKFNAKLATESLVLLKNNGILPLDPEKYNSKKNSPKICLLGPNSANRTRQLGDWASLSDRYPKHIQTTIKDALEKRLGENLLFTKGCNVISTDNGNITEAIHLAKQSDLIIIVVGDEFQYFGEKKSTATLELPGTQIELINAIAALNKPYIIDIVSSKPLLLPKAGYDASAIILQVSPGMQGGTAFDRIVFGEDEPRGRLTLSIPYYATQNPSYYQKYRGEHGKGYVDIDPQQADARYEFGYGLTYTTFQYISASLDKGVYHIDDNITVTVRIKNDGKRKGTEIIQCYVTDLLTSATWVDKELKGFAVVELQPEEIKTVQIKIPVKECSIVNAEGKRVVEEGDFKLHVGKSSKNICKSLDFYVMLD